MLSQNLTKVDRSPNGIIYFLLGGNKQPLNITHATTIPMESVQAEGDGGGFGLLF